MRITLNDKNNTKFKISQGDQIVLSKQKSYPVQGDPIKKLIIQKNGVQSKLLYPHALDSRDNDINKIKSVGRKHDATVRVGN